jgi:hypothetical protein
MNIEKIIDLIEGQIITKTDYKHLELTHGLASDLMSDVLTMDTEKTLLITGLSNIQAIRTVEMLDIHCVIVARNKKVTPEMKALAEEGGIVLIESPYSVFKAAGILYQNSIQPVY